MKKDSDKLLLSRRQVLLGAGAAAGAMALPASAAAATAKNQRWDMETDIVVVGSGAAACAAAVTATGLGAQVVVVEKMPMCGGTTNKSGGITWIPNNRFIAANGQQDNRDDCLRYMARYAYPDLYSPESKNLGLAEHDYQMLEAFYDNGAKMVDYLDEIGAFKFREFKMWDLNTVPPDYADHLPENKRSTMRALEPAIGSGPYTGGRALASQLEDWLRKQKVQFLMEHSAVGVVKEGDKVIGLEARHENKMVRIRARKAVIFGTGGYAHNVALSHLHQPDLYGSCAALGSTGDFIAIAQQAGARMGTLGSAWRMQVPLEQALENRAIPNGVVFVPGDSMIQVNKYGKRVVKEKRNYNDRTRAHFVFDPVNIEYPNQLLFMVFDERTLSRYAGNLPLPADKRESTLLIEGGNAEELTRAIARRLEKYASKIGSFRLDKNFAANLDASIRRYNGFAEAGRDEDFDRGLHDYDRIWSKFFSAASKDSRFPDNDKPNITMYPIDQTGPLYAVILAPGALDTSGGPAINRDGQVLAADGHPMPGLYGAGNCIASPTGPAYMGAGGTICLAMTFGYLAARHAVGKKA
jgi:succinate dehydrogenase/fumarate reductase flavoprotein subunit